jgi:tRNA wybutosine-synthesizing protein 4
VKNEILKVSNEVCFFSAGTSEPRVTAAMPITLSSFAPRPLLVGVSIASRGDSLVILGGSAVCFSFGTFWNKGCFTLHTLDSCHDKGQGIIKDANAQSQWRYCGISEVVAANSSDPSSPPPHTPEERSLVIVPRVRIQSTEDFSLLIRNGKPVIIEGSNIGSCTDKVCVSCSNSQGVCAYLELSCSAFENGVSDANKLCSSGRQTTSKNKSGQIGRSVFR